MKTWSQNSVRSTLKYLWICSIIVLIWQGYSSYSKLPERFATHFDISGNPDGWSSRKGFFTAWYSLLLGMNAMWLLAALLIPRTLSKTRSWMLSIPNRDYWLATDERKKECARLLNTMMFGISFLTNLMWSVIYHGIIQSSIETKIHFPIWAMFVVVGVMLIFTLIFLLTAFRKPAEQ